MALLEMVELGMRFPSLRVGGSGETSIALDGVSLEIGTGTTLAVVGESGSGKTTLARCIVRLYRPTSGRITFDGADITNLSPRDLSPIRARMSMVFQNPSTSLNPHRTVEQIIAMPLSGMDRGERRAQVATAIGRVGLDADALGRRPEAFSGGEKQRIALARSLVTEPSLLVLDEPMSALDAVARAELNELLATLQRELGLTMLIIAHDLRMVRQVADRIAVMHRGKVVEQSSTEALFAAPRHPRTRALLDAIPRLPDPSSAGRPA